MTGDGEDLGFTLGCLGCIRWPINERRGRAVRLFQVISVNRVLEPN